MKGERPRLANDSFCSSSIVISFLRLSLGQTGRWPSLIWNTHDPSDTMGLPDNWIRIPFGCLKAWNQVVMSAADDEEGKTDPA